MNLYIFITLVSVDRIKKFPEKSTTIIERKYLNLSKLWTIDKILSPSILSISMLKIKIKKKWNLEYYKNIIVRLLLFNLVTFLVWIYFKLGKNIKKKFRQPLFHAFKPTLS